MRIAIIPARKGSKRLPLKHMLDFNGKPLVEWTIIAAVESKLFDHIIVSTDWEKIIAELAPKYPDVMFHQRPKRLAQDNTTMQAVLNHELQIFDMSNPHEFCLLQPTSPLRKAEHIIMTHNAFNKRFNSLFTVNRFTLKPNGAVYWFRDRNDMWKPPSFIFMFDQVLSIDIDNIWDFRVGEVYMK